MTTDVITQPRGTLVEEVTLFEVGGGGGTVDMGLLARWEMDSLISAVVAVCVQDPCSAVCAHLLAAVVLSVWCSVGKLMLTVRRVIERRLVFLTRRTLVAGRRPVS